MAQLKQKAWSIILVGLITSLVAAFFLLFTQPAYRADMNFLITLKNATDKDYYTVSRSAEYVGKALSEVVVSEQFLEMTFEKNLLDRKEFPVDKKERLKQWNEMVSVSRGSDFGFLKIRIFGESSRESQRVAKAVSEILSTNTENFLGENSSVEMKVLSGPIVERNPSFSELIAAGLGGLFLGMFAAAFVILYRSAAPYPEAYR